MKFNERCVYLGFIIGIIIIDYNWKVCVYV